MPEGRWLTRGSGFGIAHVRCGLRCPHFAASEQERGHVLVAVRRGAFVRRADGQDVLADSSVAYLSAPETVEQFAHPFAGGDACIAIHLAPSLLASLAGGAPDLSVPILPMDTPAVVAVANIARMAQAGDDTDGALAEQVVRLVANLLARRHPDRVCSGRPATAAAQHRLVNQAREQILADPRVGVVELSRRIGYSPHHVSRTFSRLTGQSITGYRNLLRLSRVLDRLSQGDTDLARLAAELGFADHAHLTRTIAARTGRAPSRWRSASSPAQARR